MATKTNILFSSAAEVRRALRRLADPHRADVSRRFFKTGPGHYGENDEFIGVTVPQARLIARRGQALSLAEIGRLLDSPVHEDRLTALVILVTRYRRAGQAEQKGITAFYLAHRDHVNSWDLVDLSAEHIIGPSLNCRTSRLLTELVVSDTIWHRRIAVLATFARIKQNDFSWTLNLAQRLLPDPHDLIHKAVGWMLREVGKRDKHVLKTFLDAHAVVTPRTMLRYAIERIPKTVRRRYLALKSLKRTL